MCVCVCECIHVCICVCVKYNRVHVHAVRKGRIVPFSEISPGREISPNYRSLLQKSPIKETRFYKRDHDWHTRVSHTSSEDSNLVIYEDTILTPRVTDTCVSVMVSFVESSLFYRALLQKKPIILWMRGVTCASVMVSFVESSLFYRALLQKRPIILWMRGVHQSCLEKFLQSRNYDS